MKRPHGATRKSSQAAEAPATISSDGAGAIAVAPPDYGLDFVDHAPPAVLAPVQVQCALSSGAELGGPRQVGESSAVLKPGGRPPASAGKALPADLKAGIESLSGLDLSAVRVHENSAQPARINALAYTQGSEIHLGPGQERHLPHEAWHVVQQSQGRVLPAGRTGGMSVNDDLTLEREADVMGEAARRRDSVTSAGQSLAGAVQQTALSAAPTAFGSGVRAPVIQCRIAITPDAYARGLGVLPNNLTNSQISDYLNVAVLDDLKFALHKASETKDTAKSKDLQKKVHEYKTQSTAQQKVAVIQQLIVLVNDYLNDATGSYQDKYDVEGRGAYVPLANRNTRYASGPEGGYSHTSLSTGMAEGTKWQSDDDMWSQFGADLSQGVSQGTYAETAARGMGRLALKQLPWAEAKRILPRPLINLIFDVRFQLESGGNTVIDERTPYEQERRAKSPNAPGTLRSWHQDSPMVLPDNQFQADAVPGHATALHQHYTRTSQSGAGSSIGEGVSSPEGYAEYTGTGSNWEHNTKIVLDYISKRVYLTVTHYQYWALIDDSGTFKFWGAETQELSQAQGRLKDKLEKEGKTTAPTILMSPWIEILF